MISGLRSAFVLGVMAAAAVVVALVPAGLLSVAEALQAVLLVLIAGAVSYVAYAVRRADGKIARMDARLEQRQKALRRETGDGLHAIRGAVGDLERAVTSQREQARRTAESVAERLGAVQARVDETAERLTRLEQDLPQTVRGKIREDLAGGLARVERVVRTGLGDTYGQVEAFTDIRMLLNPKAPLPRLRGWAASPDLLRLLITRVIRHRPELVVECGSGSSSVFLGYALQQFTDGGRVVALEGEERFAHLTRDLVAAHGLAEIVDVRLAPLEDWQGRPWYARSAWKDLKGIDLLLVDGPPAKTGPEARYPAVPALLDSCSPGVMIVLDDTVREDEQAVSERWLAENPGLARTEAPAEKGAHIFERRSG